MPSQAVIFDVDGVLVDSYNAHLESWVRIARENGVEFTEDDFARTFGRTSRDIIREYWPGEPDERRIRDIDDRKEALYREIIADSFPAMDGAADLIRALHDAGVAIAAGSSGPPENVDLAVSKLGVGEVVQARVTGRDVTHGKPHPDVFLVAAKRLGVEPMRCVVVEDAAAGVEAAHRAGMRCVGLVSTGRTRDELAHAELVVDALSDLNPQRLRSLVERAD